jgi:hypothetical protein
VQRATEQYEEFGLFLRAMTGLDYEAAAIAFAGVRSSQTFHAAAGRLLRAAHRGASKERYGRSRRPIRITVHAASARSRGSVHRCTDRCHRGGLAGRGGDPEYESDSEMAACAQLVARRAQPDRNVLTDEHTDLQSLARCRAAPSDLGTWPLVCQDGSHRLAVGGGTPEASAPASARPPPGGHQDHSAARTACTRPWPPDLLEDANWPYGAGGARRSRRRHRRHRARLPATRSRLRPRCAPRRAEPGHVSARSSSARAYTRPEHR